MTKSIALVLKGYPRLSETFIAQEIHALEQQGFAITLISLRHPTDHTVHPIHREIKAPVVYLPEYLHHEPMRVIRSLWTQLLRPHFWSTLRLWWQDFRRDPTRNRIRRLGQSWVLATELPPETQQLYAHFIHTPGSVTRYTSHLTGIPWSASAHAKDIWTTPSWDLADKLEDMAWLTTCTQSNQQYLQSLTSQPDKVILVYHGLDFNRFPITPEPRTTPPSTQVHILSVGRAVPKKGYDVILEALAKLPSSLSWHFTHVGQGPELSKLQHQAEQLGIANKITWQGAQSQQMVLSQYRQADIFILGSRITEDGDRDGLPNVLMEAQSQHVACIATAISGIPELIIDKQTGLLVPPEDVSATSQALQQLITQPEWRQTLAEAGYKRVTTHFSLQQGIATLATCFAGSCKQ
ncbi:glycosyltransferase family 4 protein [Zooshikella sp. RANM57]|uniref:glycosyltransferase family 4 protein n=1 Tax=Zooshikella sp. RANM57 TaxID=3425863 RepID=UPI003D6FE688